MTRSATTPSQPPAAPQSTSATFDGIPSREPCLNWATSIAAEYAATSSAERRAACALGPSALSMVNPNAAKATMLYVFRNSTWNKSVEGDVRSYTSLLVAAQNNAAASASALAIHHALALPDSEESP
jgi:hypothetical protein